MCFLALVSLFLFQAMTSEVVNVKLCIHNNIHNVKMSPSGVTEVLVKGLNSTMVKTIMQSRPDSVVTGQFANPVELLSVINQSDVSSNAAQQEEVMEFEVWLCFLFYECLSKGTTLITCLMHNMLIFIIR